MADMDSSGKRCKNFSSFDRNVLLDIIIPLRHIVENKRIDNANVKIKNNLWEKITERYNKSSETGPRTTKQLHALYDNMKKRRNNKLETQKITDNTFKNDELDKKLELILQTQLEAQKVDIDSSTIFLQESSNSQTNTGENDPLYFSNVSVKCHSPQGEDGLSECVLASPINEAEIQQSLDDIDSQPRKKARPLDLFTDRIVERKNVKDQLSTDLVIKNKNAILEIEETIKKKQKQAVELDIACKEVQYRIVKKDEEIKNLELQMKQELLEHTRMMQKIELRIKTNELAKLDQ